MLRWMPSPFLYWPNLLEIEPPFVADQLHDLHAAGGQSGEGHPVAIRANALEEVVKGVGGEEFVEVESEEA